MGPVAAPVAVVGGAGCLVLAHLLGPAVQLVTQKQDWTLYQVVLQRFVCGVGQNKGGVRGLGLVFALVPFFIPFLCSISFPFVDQTLLLIEVVVLGEADGRRLAATRFVQNSRPDARTDG